MIDSTIYTFLISIFSWFTKLDMYNIFYSNKTISLTPIDILTQSFDWNLIVSMLPKLIIPSVLGLVIIISYLLWIISTICCSTYKKKNFIRCHNFMIYMTFLIFAIGLSISILNNVYGYKFGSDIEANYVGIVNN